MSSEIKSRYSIIDKKVDIGTSNGYIANLWSDIYLRLHPSHRHTWSLVPTLILLTNHPLFTLTFISF